MNTQIDEKGDTQTVEVGRPFVENELHEKSKEDVIREATMQPVGGLAMSPEELRLHRRVNLKYDSMILPVITFMYLFNGLDRSNIGNAATVDFFQDIHSDAISVNNAVTLFNVTFVLFMPISVYTGKRVGFGRWLPILMLGWGLMTLCHAFMKNEGTLIFLRLMIGMFEAGYYPSSAYYFASCYVRYDLALRLGIFYGSYAIAGAFGSVLAYGILQIKSSLHPWQYLFIIEGCFTMALALFALFWLPLHPAQAWFLNPAERDFAVERMHRDSGGQDYQARGITRQDIRDTLKDWKLWCILPINTFAGIQQNGFTVFLPLIVQQLGYKSFHANLYSVPIYVVGAVGLWTITYSSDHFKERTKHWMGAVITVVIGLVLAVALTNPHARYAALCIMQIGNFATSPLMTSLLTQNTPNPGHRAMALAINSMSNIGGIIAGQLFRPSFAPRYLVPFYVSLALVVLTFCGMVVFRWYLHHVNRWRAAKLAEMTPEEIMEENLGDTRRSDKKWTFQYST